MAGLSIPLFVAEVLGLGCTNEADIPHEIVCSALQVVLISSGRIHAFFGRVLGVLTSLSFN